MKKSSIIRLAAAFLCAALLTAAAASGALYTADAALSDALYQRPRAQAEDILLVGIDQRALETLGPWPWSREVMAAAIEALNADEERRPAVIGVDALFVGQTDPDADKRLAEAAGKYGNVVMAAAATFGTKLTEREDGSFYMNDYAIVSFDEPFEALKAGTAQGHINAMLDTDGVMRHSILWVEPSPGQRVYSFAWMLYERYLASQGLSPEGEPPTDARGRWYLPFAAKPGGYDAGLSVADLLNGDVPADYIDGRIVLIGPYAAGLQDSYPTAVDHAENMYGVEIQANAINALLDGQYKNEISELPQLAALFLVSFLALLFFWDRRVLTATIAWLAASVGCVALCRIAYDAGAVLHVLWAPLSLSVIFVAAVAVNYARSLRERRRITDTFKRYVDPSIIGELLREDSESLGLGGKQCDIAVLFVDIRGFTSMSEALMPTEVVEILNRYLSLTTDCVMKNRGTLDKFVGDCTMAIWNAPLPQEDYVMLACRAALDMVQGAKALGDELQERWGRTVSFGVGVHCGSAVVGNIGAQMRMDFTAIGDTVNTAARLEANAPAGRIYVSKAVADALEGRVRVTSLGCGIKLKGKADGFEIFTLDALAEQT